MSNITLALADDHPVYLEGLAMVLENQRAFQVKIKAVNGLELLKELEAISVDIIILDINMPLVNGMECLDKIKKQDPESKIIMLSMLDDQATIQKCFGLGACCYLTKCKVAEEIVEAVNAVHQTGFYYTQKVSRALHENNAQSDFAEAIYLRSGIQLTNKDIQIIQYICQEMTSEEIAQLLRHSKRSIETYRNNIIKKIGCKNVAGIVTFAVKNRIVYC